MNRLQATVIKYNDLFSGIEHEQAEPCPQLNEKVMFIEHFTIDMLAFSPEFVVHKLVKDYICFYDNGTEEKRVINNDYKIYALKNLYETRTGKYDIVEPDLELK